MSLKSHPPDFAEWPRPVKLDWTCMSMRRVGLLRVVLTHAGFNVREMDLHTDRRLTKTHLAGIYLAFEGYL